ncbi:MAG: tRNA 2-thiouridine synthesizing protein A [Pseudohongiellaceae bacterium]|jgi:tRNA 2-thiouridine synthesizing protein A|nr:sulfurtransferase TusA [Pseudomonadota bacterium]MDA1292029.1 sulfurtransferase TusA [Pseudomonadota bacterium]
MSNSEEQSDTEELGLNAALELDASGLFCPEPVMLLHNKIRDIDAGQLLKLVATDPSTSRDVPKFCHFLGHELLESTQEDGSFVYLIRKVKS